MVNRVSMHIPREIGPVTISQWMSVTMVTVVEEK